MRKLITLATLVVFAMLAMPAMAGEGPGGPKGDECGKDEACHQKKMKEMRGKMLREKVGLAEEKAKQVEGVLDQFHDRHMALRKAFKENMKALKDLVKADSGDQEAYKKAMEAIKSNHEAQRALMEEQMEAMKKILTPKEQAKLFLAHERMGQKMMKWKKGKEGHDGKGHKGEGHHGDCGCDGDDD